MACQLSFYQQKQTPIKNTNSPHLRNSLSLSSFTPKIPKGFNLTIGIPAQPSKSFFFSSLQDGRVTPADDSITIRGNGKLSEVVRVGLLEKERARAGRPIASMVLLGWVASPSKACIWWLQQ